MHWATASCEHNMIQFACPTCGVRYRVGAEFAGRRTKCRQCGQPLQVPAPKKTPIVPAQIVEPEPVEEVISEVTTVEPIPEVLPASFVTFTPKGEIRVQVSNSAEAKATIRELRSKEASINYVQDSRQPAGNGPGETASNLEVIFRCLPRRRSYHFQNVR